MPDDMIPKLRTPEYPETHKRGKLGKREQAALVLRQDGRCAGCGIKPRFGFEFDHIDELREGGTNDLDNWQAFGSRRDCKCHATKTALVAKRHAKTRRLRGETGQLKRRRENGPQIKSRPLIETRESRSPSKWQSAGFRRDPKMKRTVSGKVIPR